MLWATSETIGAPSQLGPACRRDAGQSHGLPTPQSVLSVHPSFLLGMTLLLTVVAALVTIYVCAAATASRRVRSTPLPEAGPPLGALMRSTCRSARGRRA